MSFLNEKCCGFSVPFKGRGTEDCAVRAETGTKTHRAAGGRSEWLVKVEGEEEQRGSLEGEGCRAGTPKITSKRNRAQGDHEGSRLLAWCGVSDENRKWTVSSQRGVCLEGDSQTSSPGSGSSR